jgi:hypothetical protein
MRFLHPLVGGSSYLKWGERKACQKLGVDNATM